MLPVAVIAHSAQGRTRFKIAARRRDAQYFATVEERLSASSDVERVQANPVTGSVLVHHRGPPDALHKYAEEQKLFRVSTLADRASNLVRRQSRSWDQQLLEFTGGYLDLRSLTFITLVSIGLVQALRGQLAGPALTLFSQATSQLKGADDDTSSETSE
jgi:hypothetical protein